MRTEKRQLRTEKCQLRTEKRQLRTEKRRLRTEKCQLRTGYLEVFLLSGDETLGPDPLLRPVVLSALSGSALYSRQAFPGKNRR